MKYMILLVIAVILGFLGGFKSGYTLAMEQHFTQPTHENH